MNLKDFLTNRDSPPELYWSLVIEKKWVQAGIWYIKETSAEVLDISPGASWEDNSELVGACDTALSSCVSKLPDNYKEPNKTVFGVPSSWVKDGEIADEFLAIIKDVCTELSLTPVGFVVLPEAIAHLYKSEEKSPLNAVVIGLGQEELGVSVFNLGNLVGTTTVARSISIVEDVIEGLSRFNGISPLPSRIIVFDGKGGELEDAKEELIKNNWEESEKIKFLHTPKVEILESDKKVLATCLAGAAEIGNVTEIFSSDTGQNEESYPPEEEIRNIETPSEETTAESLGFSINEDITNLQPGGMNIPEETTFEIKESNRPVAPAVSQVVTESKSELPKARNLFHNLSSKFLIKSPKISSSGKRNNLYLVLVIVFVLTIGIFFYWWMVPKAVVTIFVSPKPYQQQVNISFSGSGQFEESKAVIPAQILTLKSNGEKTKSTTGVKLTGEKATGSVQIANGNGSSINLAAGTILTSSSGLRFVTNTEASISGQLLPGTPGTATLAITAGDIGAQYNLAKGEVFKVGAFEKSSVAATSQSDFSGGSSQQMAAVSSEDQKKVEDELKEELSEKVRRELSDEISDDQVLVDDLAGLDVVTENFDREVGEITDKIKLSLSIEAVGVLANKEKLIQYTTNVLKDKIPSGYVLRNNQIDFEFKFVGKENDYLVYETDIGANFLPMTSSTEISNKITGRTLENAKEYLTSVPGYVRADISLRNSLPGPFKTLPHMSKNIVIEIAADQ